jgi:hypothetical protein
VFRLLIYQTGIPPSIQSRLNPENIFFVIGITFILGMIATPVLAQGKNVGLLDLGNPCLFGPSHWHVEYFDPEDLVIIPGMGCVARRLNSQLFALPAPRHAGASTPEDVNLFLREPLDGDFRQGILLHQPVLFEGWRRE